MKKISTLILRNSLLLLATLFTISSLTATAQTKPAAARITQAIDEANLVPMHSKVHPLARPEFDRGPVADSQPMNRMLLVLKRSPDQETALRSLMDEQQTKNSQNYHAWLTPIQFGQQFGVADSDIQKVTDWLAKSGFTGIKQGPGHMIIEFSGTAGLVRNAFHTEVHNFMVNGEAHIANVSVPQMPAALSPVVSGVASLHNFRKKSFTHFSEAAARAKEAGKLRPGFTAAPCSSLGPGPCFAMGPADFAKIYNIPTSGAGALDGTGETIALVARSNINVQDVQDYGNGFNISNLKTFSQASNVVLDGPDPGIVSGDDIEATLDVEASGGVAPKAKILLVVSSNSLSLMADGVDLSALYVVENNLAPIMSESFGSCEAFNNNLLDFFLWEQAAAQGITVMVSAGDNGSAGCDAPDPADGILAASNGLAVSGTASTPFNVAVGGTDFDDATNPATYWTSTNTGSGLLSAKSYIPEVPWNDTCAAAGSLTGCTVPLDSNGLDMVGGSGGQSSCSDQDQFGDCLGGYSKPTWQAGVGVPADGVRDLPDVSLFASDGNGHASGNFWVLCYAGAVGTSPQNGQACNLTGPAFNFAGVGGTSASSPAFAGIMALVDQKAGGRQGNANYVLYRLAALQAGSPGNTTCNSNGGALPASTCTFNDVTKGNNSVACDAGSLNCSNQGTSGVGIMVEPPSPLPFTATTPAWQTTAGYDLATGLGSINVTNLANNWANGTGALTPTTTTITSPASNLTITHGANETFTIKVTPATATGDVSIIASPAGSAQVAISSLTLPGTNVATLTGGTATFTTNALPGGTSYPVIARYGGDGTAGPSDSAPITITVNKESSKVAATLLIEDPSTGVTSVVSTTPYGNNYLLRVDVTNAGGVQCSAVTFAIPCPTGTITLTDNGSPLNNFLNAGGANSNSALLNVQGFAEDQFQGGTGLAGGSHSLSSTYAGDNSYTASTQTAPNVITITPALTSAQVLANGKPALSVATSQTVTLVATVVGFNNIPTSIGGTIAVGSTGAGPTGTVTFSTCGTPPCTSTVVPVSFNNSTIGAAFGTATLTTSFSTIGVKTISATFASGDGNYSGSASSGAGNATVTVVLPPAKVAFTVQPSNVAVGASITPAVQVSVEDSSGNVVASATNPVTIAIANNAGPGGVLSGTLTATPVNGVATFSNLSINKAGAGYTLSAAATNLTSATSSAFNVTPAVAAKLAFTVQPTTVAANASITPAVQVTVEDASGNVVTTANNAVTVAIGNNAGPGGVLAGVNLTVSAVNGVATFPGLNINKAGTGYTLTAAATNLTGATSSAFNVTSGPAGFTVSYSPQPFVLSSVTGASTPLTVTVTPSGGFTGSVIVTAGSLPSGVTCPNSPLTITVTAGAITGTLNCMVTATSTTLTASNTREDRMLEAKALPPTTGSKGWWTLSAGTGFAAMFLLFLPGGRKKLRAALGLGLVCILGITAGCNGAGGGVKPPPPTATVTKLSVTSAKVVSPNTFSFSVAVTGGTPTGMVQLFDGATMIGTAATVAGGNAVPTAPALTVGTHAISAHYLGDLTTAASTSGTLNLTVTGSTTIAITSSPAATPVAPAINVTVQ